ncbi:MAG: VWA domain-containing protein [Armatimonadetes bacterium]|nr:VWA domain-containing protein [Armatimonadota bacterium]
MSRRTRLATLLVLLAAASAYADGGLIPSAAAGNPISVTRHEVTVTIRERVATTRVDQVFHNDTNRPVEAEYVFPVPAGAAIRSFSVVSGRQELTTTLMQGTAARSYFEAVVRRRKDPGLLQYLGQDAVRSRVFPVPAHGDVQMVVQYQELLQTDAGLTRYLYPLLPEKWSAKPLQKLSVTVSVETQTPLRALYSPTHNVSILRQGDRAGTATYAAENVMPDRDLLLYYGETPREVALDLLPFREGNEGYFLLLLTPGPPPADESLPKTVLFVVDHSGSMSGEKIEQAKEALLFCLRGLGPEDKFHITAYNDAVTELADELLPAADRTARAKAEAFVKRLDAGGSTNIHEALLRSLKAAGSDPLPRYVIFLTDGLPTAGVTDTDQIVKDVTAANAGKARLFAFGVGYDYNAQFIDKLALANHGYADNVLPEESIEAKISSFYAKLSKPALTDLAVEWSGAPVTDVHPEMLPDLFHGSELSLVGRYGQPGHLGVAVTGRRGGKAERYTAGFDLPASSTSHDFVPVLWATRRIGYLQDTIRLEGENETLVKELVDLSRRFGIMTEFTAFLATQDEGAKRVAALALSPSEQLKRALDSQRRAVAVDTGAWAVSQSMNSRAQRNAAQVQANAYRDARGQVQEVRNMINLANRAFVQDGKQWVDLRTAARPPQVKVAAYSPAWFQLANSSRRLAQYLALGDAVVVDAGNQAVEVGPGGRTQAFTASELKHLLGTEPAATPMGQAPAVRAQRHARAGGFGLAFLAGCLVVPGLLVRRGRSAA